MKIDRSLENEVILTARKFAARHIAPVASDADHSGPAFPAEVFAKGIEAGFDRLALPENSGGSGLGMNEVGLLIETLARTCAGHAMVFGVQAAVTNSLREICAEEPGGIAREMVASRRPIAPALPEPLSGMDFDAGFTIAEKGTGFLVSGERLVVNAAPSAAILAFAKDPDGALSAILLDVPGLDSPEPALGLRAMPIVLLRLEDYNVPRDRVIARGPAATDLASGLLRGLCLVASAAASGVMSAACRKAYAYTAERYQGGKMIIDHSHLRSILGGMSALAKASEGAVRDAAARPEDLLSALGTKAAVTGNAVKVCTDAVQVLGGYGYMRDFGLEKMMRDAAVLSLIPISNNRAELLMAAIEKESTD